MLVPQDRHELLHLLIDRIVVDLAAGGLRIVFHEIRCKAALPASASAEAARPQEAET